MASIKVLRTDGEAGKIMEQYPEAIHIHLLSKWDAKSTMKDIGDFVQNDKAQFENYYGIIDRDEIGDKSIPEGVRLGLIQLLKHLIEEDKKPSVLLIGHYSFSSIKQESIFLCILRELLITYFGEAYADDEVTLIIYGYNMDHIKIKV